MPRVVILGTGTNVGKTFVACALARALAAQRSVQRVHAVKPVETGVDRPGSIPPRGSDAAKLERAAPTTSLRPHPLYAFPDAVSAHLAARRCGQRVSIPAIARWVSAMHDTALHTWSIVETAGGALSPVSARATNLDVAAALLPARVVLVAPDALGVLHDLRATLAGMAARGLPPDFVVLSAARGRDASTGTNAAELPRVGLPRPIAVVPKGDTNGRSLSRLVRELVAQAQRDSR
jgi:dethiobiotin synthetase